MDKMEIKVCPNCGSLNITSLESTTILVIGGFLPLKYTCRDCGYRGMPIILASIKDHKKFLKEKKKGK